MDGLTVSTASELVNTGKTFTEMQKQKLTAGSPAGGPESFQNTLKDALDKVNDIQKDADIKMQKLASGESSNISEVMIATEKADIALKLMMSVRNKMIDAYQEIMKMQV